MIYRSRILNISLIFLLQSATEFCHHFSLPIVEIAGKDMLAGLSYEPQIESKVVNRGYLHGQQFIGAHKPSNTRGLHTTVRRATGG